MTSLTEALAIERERGPDLWLANALEMSARLAATDGEPTLALRLYAHAALLREIVGTRLHYELGWPDPTSHLGELRSRVGEETFEEEWARGRAMTLLEAIDEATRRTTSSTNTSRARCSPGRGGGGSSRPRADDGDRAATTCSRIADAPCCKASGCSLAPASSVECWPDWFEPSTAHAQSGHGTCRTGVRC